MLFRSTNHAVNAGKITVFGGAQMRPNLHLKDMVAIYKLLLTCDDKLIAGEIFNAGYQNYSVSETAEIVRKIVGQELPDRKGVEIVTTPSDDIRSYRVNADKIKRVLGFTPQFTVEDAVRDLVKAFGQGKLPNSMTDVNYFNIKKMQSVKLA